MIDRIIETVASTLVTVMLTLGIYLLFLWLKGSVKDCYSKSKKKLK